MCCREAAHHERAIETWMHNNWMEQQHKKAELQWNKNWRKKDDNNKKTIQIQTLITSNTVQCAFPLYSALQVLGRSALSFWSVAFAVRFQFDRFGDSSCSIKKKTLKKTERAIMAEERITIVLFGCATATLLTMMTICNLALSLTIIKKGQLLFCCLACVISVTAQNYRYIYSVDSMTIDRYRRSFADSQIGFSLPHHTALCSLFYAERCIFPLIHINYFLHFRCKHQCKPKYHSNALRL